MPKEFLRLQAARKGSVRWICFAVKASKGLKLLFALCLADSASQNYQKLSVVVAGFGEMAGIHASAPPASVCSSFTLMARSVTLFLSFSLPLLHPALYQSDKVCVVAPTGKC